MAEPVQRLRADFEALQRRYDAPWSPERRARLAEFLRAARAELAALDYEAMALEEQIDWQLLRSYLDYALFENGREESRWSEVALLLPCAASIWELQRAQRALEPIDPQRHAAVLADLSAQLQELHKRVDAGSLTADAAVALRAAGIATDLAASLSAWHAMYAGYDPLFSWWTQAPFQAAQGALEAYRESLRTKLVGVVPGQDEPIVGDPIGRAALDADLLHEWIPYSAEELLAIGEREFAWCQARMLEAAREMGCGDDWKAALERVKQDHVAPGGQVQLVAEQAREAVAFLEERELLTIPPQAKEIWRAQMLTSEDQKTSPFFLGGEVIRIAFPTDAMAHADKLMSLRGNNVHFARATVHHELIPGHHLQGFMNERYQAHRQFFDTPFWTEGWALYWEMRLWDLGFPKTAQNRVGMLFWRMHRCARIVFSLSFHLGRMSPAECVDFLVERVGHERANATAEVRRSFNGSYPPLYQAGYMLGALQLRALWQELVASGRMQERAFHDAVLQGGPMPIELVRARLTQQAPPRDARPSWRF